MTTTWCFCQACSSLLTSCCGNDKPSTVPPSVTSGRKRSVFLLVLGVGFCLALQYGVAPAMVQKSPNSFLRNAWIDGCEEYSLTLQIACAGNSGVYRASLATTIFFVLAALAASCKTTANREAWPAKYILYFFLVVAMCFVPNKPVLTEVYLNVARIAAVLFIFLQQIIIVDMVYNWNDSWVTKADKAEAEEPGSGKKWLAAILFSCACLFVVSFVGIVLMFVYFSGCRSNMAFIGMTLGFCVFLTAAQLFGGEGSLLSSASVSAWAVYLLYSAISKNPNANCNPKLVSMLSQRT
jgi:hypothetical protein